MSGPRKSILWADVISLRRQLKGCDPYVLMLLGRHTDRDGWCRRRQRRMAEELGLDRVTITRSLKRLVGLGCIEVHPTWREDGGKGASWYRLTEQALQADLFPGVPAAAPPASPAPHTPAAETQQTHVARTPHTPVAPAPHTHVAPGDSSPRVVLATHPMSRTGDSSSRTTTVERNPSLRSGAAQERHPKSRIRKSPPGQRELIPAVDAAAGARSPPPAPSRRMRPDWLPNELDYAFAVQAGLLPSEVGRLAERFRNHHAGGARRASWSGPWRNWVMDEVEKGKGHGRRGEDRQRSEAERIADAFADLARRKDGAG